MSEQDNDGGANDTNKLVIGLKNSLVISNDNNNNQSLSHSPNSRNNNNNNNFKPVAPTKSGNRAGALSPLGVKEKQKSVSFSPMVVEFESTSSSVNSSNNVKYNSYNSSELTADSISNTINTNSSSSNNQNSNNSNNNNNSLNQLSSQNINSFIDNLNSVSNERKQKFNKLGGNDSEIFQFDEEYEEELQEIEEKKQQQQQQDGGSSGVEASTSNNSNNNNNNNNMSDDEDEPSAPSNRAQHDANRSRSNGLLQELKLGTSLPVQIPSRVQQQLQLQQHQSSQKNQQPKNSFAAMDFSIESEREKKKYVTPRQSWVDTFKDKGDDMAASFAVPMSLSRKPKSFI